MKAYMVEAGGYGKIVLAETPGKARYEAHGTDLFCNHEFIDLSVRRAPEFDNYKHDPTPRELVEGHGWWQACQGCERQVSDSSPRRFWEDDDTVFCTKGCKRMAEKRSRRWKRENEKADAEHRKRLAAHALGAAG